MKCGIEFPNYLFRTFMLLKSPMRVLCGSFVMESIFTHFQPFSNSLERLFSFTERRIFVMQFSSLSGRTLEWNYFGKIKLVRKLSEGMANHRHCSVLINIVHLYVMLSKSIGHIHQLFSFTMFSSLTVIHVFFL